MARSYKYLCKRAGLAAPTGFAKIERAYTPSKPHKSATPDRFVITSESVLHAGKTLVATWDAKQIPGLNLQNAILLCLGELKSRLTRDGK